MAAADHARSQAAESASRASSLIAVSVLFLAAILIMPVVSVLAYAFSRGASASISRRCARPTRSPRSGSR